MLSLTVLAGVSCGSGQTNSGQQLEGITWVLKSYGNPDSLTQVLPDKEVTISFDKAKGQISGNGGVNGYGGTYILHGNQLTISDVVHTMIASTNQALNEQENTFFKILQSAESFNISNGTLTITGAEGNLVFSQK
jgi:putative lipoprotein